MTEEPQSIQPVGPAVDSRPAAKPGPVTLAGRFGRIEKLESRHAEHLWEAIQGRDRLWTYMPSAGPFGDASSFATWVAERAAQNDPCFYAIIDTTGRALGLLSLLNIRPEHGVIEVGHILYAPALQRTPLATEAQYLLARYVFETLGYRRYEWKCDSLNARSRSAALRLGFTFEGIFRQHMITKGRNRDTAWFSMLDSEWPAREAKFERWLAPDNFDAAGRQRLSLTAMSGSGG